MDGVILIGLLTYNLGRGNTSPWSIHMLGDCPRISEFSQIYFTLLLNSVTTGLLFDEKD